MLCCWYAVIMCDDNLVVKQITDYTMLSPRSNLADNYKNLYGKYKYSYND